MLQHIFRKMANEALPWFSICVLCILIY